MQLLAPTVPGARAGRSPAGGPGSAPRGMQLAAQLRDGRLELAHPPGGFRTTPVGRIGGLQELRGRIRDRLETIPPL